MVDEFLMRRWFTLQMVVRGTRVDLATAEGLYATDGAELVGLVTFRFHDTEMEILSLDSVHEGRGIGTLLLDAVMEEARNRDCSRVMLITTNDNTAALRFYQRRGFDMVRLYRNALEQSRRLKPEIPLIGEDGIPLRHEIELEMML